MALNRVHLQRGGGSRCLVETPRRKVSYRWVTAPPKRHPFSRTCRDLAITEAAAGHFLRASLARREGAGLGVVKHGFGLPESPKPARRPGALLLSRVYE